MTEYEYDIEVKTRYGWELVNCEPTFPEAKRSIAEYRENMPDLYRIKKVPCVVDAAMQVPDNER